MTKNEDKKTTAKIAGLRDTLNRKRALLIVMQDYPDPDALASAAALRVLALHLSDIRATTVSTGGIVGRAENRALARYLQLPFRPLGEIDCSRFDAVAMVDTQPGTGNNSFPPDTPVHIVIDHHPIRRSTRAAPFTDVRSRYGATSTILHEYLRASRAPIDTALATALLYGIRSDTQDLGRDATAADIEAIIALYPQANKRMLGQIQRATTPRSYFRMLAAALANARVHEHAIISCIGPIDIPDIVGEIADMALRDEEADWTLCHGAYDGQILLSIRTAAPEGDAGAVMRKVVARLGAGGGHRAMAGGQIRIEGKSPAQRKKLQHTIHRRFLKALRIPDGPGEKLIAPTPQIDPKSTTE